MKPAMAAQKASETRDDGTAGSYNITGSLITS